jgi:CTP synthase
MSKTKYIFVTGGVLSGVGKGITAASLGAVLKSKGLNISIQKLDQYLNVDAGTLNPAEHGECFVTHDGAETDLDLGHYERFMDIEPGQESSVMSGRLLRQVIEDERAGKFLGSTVQLIPHLTGAIHDAIMKAAAGSDIHMAELGGTVGDYEGLAFVEGIREFAQKVGRENCIFVHVVYVPYLAASKELKTKPAQNAIHELRGFGVVPDVIMARMDITPIRPEEIRRKISLFGGVQEEGVVLLPNADTVYRVPLTLDEAGIGDFVLKRFGMKSRESNLEEWRMLVERATRPNKPRVKIGIVAKYLSNEDTYFSVTEALKAAGWHHGVDADYRWVDAERIEKHGTDELEHYDGIVVPGGFGTRGVEGKIASAMYCLENNKPYLGLCLGLQVAVLAASRRGGIKQATSAELNPNAKDQAIYIMENQKGKESTGGTMRLGGYTAELKKGSLTAQLYEAEEVIERHRHRYEVNRKYETAFEKGGLKVSGESPNGRLVEFIEAPGHPFFVATQAHPEFRSRPTRPHPLFAGFIAALK